jgi:ribosomal protein S12 methylthiotransferase
MDQYFGTTELPALLKALGADYKHELLGERLTTTPKKYHLKLPKVATDLVVLCYPIMRGKHVSQTIEKLVKEAEGLARDGVKEILIAQDLTYYGLIFIKNVI